MTDDNFDARLRAALAEPGDDRALAQAVLTRLVAPSRGPSRRAVQGFALAWVVTVGLGWQLCGQVIGDPLLGLALGEAPAWAVTQ